MMNRIGLGALILGGAVFWGASAGAQDQHGSGSAQHQVKQQQGVLQVGEITIVGRVQKPVAAVDVAKILPKLTLAELRQPFLDRIEQAVHQEPF
ncbi:MAG TPA: hypothetical protein VEK07_21525 [Polyangiaceae bacterium]|nr:hypothetical protein [Polyangiaceae bacterium]